MPNKSLLLLTTLFSLNAFAADDAETEKDFTLDGEVGLLFTTGNTETSSFKGRLSSHHELLNWSNDYVVESLYKREEVDTDDGEETQTSAQKFYISGQANYKLTNPDNRLFMFGSYEDDRFSGFDYQSTVAAGWNSKLWDDQESMFSYSLGPGYAIARTSEGEDRNSVIVRAAADYQWKVSDFATFKQIVSTEVGSENTKSRSETSLTAKINGAMSLKISLTLNHNSNVEADNDKLDTETAATLVYSFF